MIMEAEESDINPLQKSQEEEKTPSDHEQHNHVTDEPPKLGITEPERSNKNDLYFEEEKDDFPGAMDRPEPSINELRRRKRVRRRELECQQANNFLKQPVVKIMNHKKDLKRAYEKGFLDDTKFDFIKKLRKIRRHPEQDSISSHCGSGDSQFDIKDAMPTRLRRHTVDGVRHLSSDSDSEKETRKRKVSKPRQPRKPKIENGEPVPKKPRKPRDKSKPTIKIAKAPAKKSPKKTQKVKIEKPSKSRKDEEQQQSQQQHSQQKSSSKSLSLSSDSVKAEKESKDVSKVLQKSAEQKNKQALKQIKKSIQQSVANIAIKEHQKTIQKPLQKPIEKIAQKIPAAPTNIKMPIQPILKPNNPSIPSRIDVTNKKTAALQKKYDESSSSSSSSSSSNTSSSASDSSSDRSRSRDKKKQKKKKKHRRHRSSSQSSHDKKKRQKRKKYDDSQTAKEISKLEVKPSKQAQPSIKEQGIKFAYSQQKEAIPDRNVQLTSKQTPQLQKSEGQAKKEIRIQSSKQLSINISKKALLPKLQTKLALNRQGMNQTPLEAKKAQTRIAVIQKEDLKQPETSEAPIKRSTKIGDLKFDPKVVILSLMTTAPNTHSKPPQRPKNTQQTKPKIAIRLKHPQADIDSSSQSSYVQYRKPYRHPQQRIVRYRKVVVSESSSKSSSEDYVQRRIVKRVRKSKVLVESSGSEEQVFQYKTKKVDPKPKPGENIVKTK